MLHYSHIELRVNRILKAHYFIFYRNSNINNKLTSQVIRLLELVWDYAVDFDMNDMYVKKRVLIWLND